MVLVITTVLTYFPCFVVRLFFVRSFLFSWDFLFLREIFYFPHETFYFCLRLFLFLWDFFFYVRLFLFCETFFFYPWDFLFFPWKCFSWKLFYPKWKFLVNHKKGFDRLCSLCLVLWARHFYSVEKEEVKRAKRLW